MPTFTFTNIDFVSLVGSLGTIVVAVVLYRMQKQSVIEQAYFAQRLTDESAAKQATFSQALAERSADRQSAVDAFININRHCQTFIYAFRNRHPENLPFEQTPNSPIITPAGPNSAIAHERAMQLLDVIADLNTDRMMMGFIFGDEKAKPTNLLIEQLVIQGAILLEESRQNEIMNADKHFHRNAALIDQIGKTLRPLWEYINRKIIA